MQLFWSEDSVVHGWGVRISPLSGARLMDASPSLCSPASLWAVVDMNQATDTDLFKVGQQPPNQLCVPKSLVTPHPHHSPLQLHCKLALAERPVVGFPQQLDMACAG